MAILGTRQGRRGMSVEQWTGEAEAHVRSGQLEGDVYWRGKMVIWVRRRVWGLFPQFSTWQAESKNLLVRKAKDCIQKDPLFMTTCRHYTRRTLLATRRPWKARVAIAGLLPLCQTVSALRSWFVVTFGVW